MAVVLADLRSGDPDNPGYLEDTSWTNTDLEDALAAESAAQAKACEIPADPGPGTVDLDQALKRRVAVNLIRRRWLTDDNRGDSDSPPPLPSRDPEVRRLEAYYRRLVMG